MANNDSGERKKSDGGLSKPVLWIACVCMIAPVLALVAIPLVASVEPNFAINILIAAATILTVIMVLVGLVLFSKLRDVKDEYDRICGIRDKAEALLEKAREKVESALKEVDTKVKEADNQLLAQSQKLQEEVKQAVDRKYEERERKAEEEQKKRLEISERVNKGLTLLKRKKYDDAIAEFTKCIELDPKDAVVYYNLGCVYARKGEKTKAIECLNKAVDNGDRDLKYWETDHDLDSIRDEPGYKEVVKRLKRLRGSK